jgi:hypothetical protein
MSGGLTFPKLLPRQYILRGEPVSPLTCGHPSQAKCACRGNLPPASAKPASPAAPKRAAATAAHIDAAVNRVEQAYEKKFARILYIIRGYPEALAAVSEAFTQEGAVPDPPPQQDPYA